MLKHQKGLLNLQLEQIFLSSGLFPFIEIFNCNGSSKCGIKAVDDAFFKGKFEESNKGIITHYEAVYTSTNTYGSSQIKDHKYKIILTDAKGILCFRHYRRKFFILYK